MLKALIDFHGKKIDRIFYDKDPTNPEKLQFMNSEKEFYNMALVLILATK